MKLLSINELRFADCTLIAFECYPDLSKIVLTFEAYRINNTERSVFNLELSGIHNLIFSAGSEFEKDLERPYNPGGEDFKANEIYHISHETLENVYKIEVNADMINIVVNCLDYKLRTVNLV